MELATDLSVQPITQTFRGDRTMQERMKFGGAFALLIALVMLLSVSTPSYAQSARAEIVSRIREPFRGWGDSMRCGIKSGVESF